MKRRVFYIRIGVALLVLVIALASFHFDVAIGTLCALCPVGFIGISAASGSIPWALLPGVLIVLVLVFIFGRVFCSWLCTTSLLKNTFGGKRTRGLRGRTGDVPVVEKGYDKAKNLAATTVGINGTPASSVSSSVKKSGKTQATTETVSTKKKESSAKKSNCNGSCNKDSWGWPQFAVLGVLLVISFIVKFPVFCLICPIGLVFGTLWALNNMFVLLQPGWELIVFPAMLIAEIFLFKRWCSAICPLGAFFTLATKLRTKLGLDVKPQVNCSTCIADEGCNVCTVVCPEDIDVAHADVRDLEACTLCTDCIEQCPTKSIKAGTKTR